MTTLDDNDVEAIFYIRKARAALHTDARGDWAGDMLTASRLVGASRVEQLAEQPYCNVRVDAVDCDQCGDYGIHINDHGDRSLCPALNVFENDDRVRCDQCGETPHVIGEGWHAPICGRCLQSMWDEQ